MSKPDVIIGGYYGCLTKYSYHDPADRIIIATSLKKGAILVTSDKRILNYPHIQTIW